MVVARIVAGLVLLAVAGGAAPALAITPQASAGTQHCIQYLAQSGAFWGDPNNTKWVGKNALWLCEDNTDMSTPPAPVACFNSQMASGNANWSQAVATCRQARGLPVSSPDGVQADLQSQQQQAAGGQANINPATGGGRAEPGRTAAAGVSPAGVAPTAAATGDSNQQVTIAFTNGLQQPIDEYLLDTATQQYSFYYTLKPGETIDQQSSPGTQWSFGVNQEPVDNYLTTSAASQTYVIGSGAQQAQPAPQTQPAQQAPQVVVTNSSGQSVDVLYVGQSGQYQLYQSLPAGQSATLQSQSGLVLYFAVGGQTIVGSYTTQNQPQQQFVVTQQMLAQAGIQPAGPVAASAPPAATLVPARQPLTDQPWNAGSDQATILWMTGTTNGFLSGAANGGLQIVKPKEATSRADWYLETVPGTTDQVFIRNAADTNAFLYVGPNAGSGSAVLYGPADLSGNAGRWQQTPFPAMPGAEVFHSVAQPGLVLAVSGGSPQLAAVSGNPTHDQYWIPDPVPDMAKFLGALAPVAKAVPQIAQNVQNIEKQQQAELAKKKAAADAEAAREAQKRQQAILMAGENGLTVQLGVNNVTPSPDSGISSEIDYTYPRDPATGTLNFRYIDRNKQYQYVNLKFLPHVYAYVVNGEAYIEVTTDAGSNLISETQPQQPSLMQTPNYLEKAILDIASSFGTVGKVSPQNINGVLMVGTSQDTTRSAGLGANASPMMGPGVDANAGISNTSGQSVNGNIADYTVTSVFEDTNGTNRPSHATYTWTACGLVPGIRDNAFGTDSRQTQCTYTGPTDLFDKVNGKLYALPADATVTALAPNTDTIFALGPVANLGISAPEDILLWANVTATAASAGLTRQRTSTSKDNATAFFDGLTFKFLWDPATSNWYDAGAKTKDMPGTMLITGGSVTAKFLITMRLNLADLKKPPAANGG